MFQIILNDLKKILKKKNFYFFKKKNILIVGASGVVGQYFVGFFFLLLKTIWSPRNITIIHKNPLPRYFNFIKKSKKFKIIRDDITLLKKRYKKYDCIIFAAGYGQPSKFIKNPLETIKINTCSLNKIILKLKKGGKFLYLSSSEIYNNNDKNNLTENDIGKTNTDNPRACYIEAKRSGETISTIYNKIHNIDIKIVRLCLAYGPGFQRKDERVLNEFIKRSTEQNKLIVNDSGSAKRRYIYISDAINMMLNVMLHGKSLRYNVAGKEKLTIRQLAMKIGKILGKPVFFKKKSNLNGSPSDIKVSIKKYELEFGRVNLIKINQGLKKTINWYKQLSTQQD